MRVVMNGVATSSRTSVPSLRSSGKTLSSSSFTWCSPAAFNASRAAPTPRPHGARGGVERLLLQVQVPAQARRQLVQERAALVALGALDLAEQLLDRPVVS